MQNFILLTLGTGLGSGLVLNGKIVSGSNGLAAEYGHSLLVKNGRLCNCGQQGCFETYVSATGLKRTALSLLARSNKYSLLREIAPNDLDALKIAEAGEAGDEIAKKALTKLKPGQLATKVKPGANVAGMAVGIAADPLLNLGEALISGPAKMYSSRMGDAIKNIAAIKKLIPNDPNLTALLDSLSQQMNTGAQSFTRKAYNNKNTRVAVIGDAKSNLGDYGRQAYHFIKSQATALEKTLDLIKILFLTAV
jgi:predicted NBD/HSP70 family sugar kinase